MNLNIQKGLDWIWAILIGLLPITSMPLVAAITGSEYVAPPAMIILFLLILVWWVPKLLKGLGFPLQSMPFFGFITIAIISSAISLFTPSPPYRNHTSLHAIMEGLITLAIGGGFYLFTASFLRFERQFNLTLKVLNWSGLAIILWSLVQIGAFLQIHNFPDWMENIQAILSTSILFSRRVTGFALEPSWLAHQLNMFYLPFWLASVVRRYSAHSIRIWVFQLEDFLLLSGSIILFLSFSRVGLLAFICMLGYLLLHLNVHFIEWLEKRIYKRNNSINKRKMRLVILSGLVILVYIGSIAGLGWGLSRVDRRMEDLFNFSTQESNPILRYADSLRFGERVVYWLAAWDVYADHPIFGVGLGNVGFYMPHTIAPFGRSLVEVRNLLFRSDTLLNAKSLWFRLLAETGILGTSCFLAWLIGIWQSARYLLNLESRFKQMLGLAGVFMLVAILLEGLSIDSFALPYFWITAGIITAASIGFSENEYVLM